DPRLAVLQVEIGQVITLHEPDEVMDLRRIERVGRARGVFLHSFAPHGPAPGLESPARNPWSPSRVQPATGRPEWDWSIRFEPSPATWGCARGPRGRRGSPAHRPRSGCRPNRGDRSPGRR